MDLFAGFSNTDLTALGIPLVEEYIAQYCERMGHSSLGNWDFYTAFIFFRFSAILQGVYKRALQGNVAILDRTTVALQEGAAR